jgi:hypothetical protein
LTASKLLWDDKKFDTNIRRKCLAKNPLFDFESDATKAQQIAAECLLYGQEFQLRMLHKKVADGLFLPDAGESLDDQVQRCWREHWGGRVATPSSEDSTLCTCTRCSRIIHKTLQQDGTRLVLKNGCLCEFKSKSRTQHLTLGWQFVVGSFPNIFPDNNIFSLLVRELPSENMVVNSKQLMALLVQTIRKYPLNPQGRQLAERFDACFDGVIGYAFQDSDAGRLAQTAITSGLKGAFKNVPTGRYAVKVIQRSSKDYEVAAYTKSRAPKMFLYVFGEANEWTDERVKENENDDYLEYKTKLRQIAANRASRR